MSTELAITINLRIKMCTREIITLQVGSYSNFIGTHWWNNQESSFCYNPEINSEAFEINHDVLFREGQNARGEITYTPRLVAVDLKHNLNSLKKDGVLYNMPPVKTSLPAWQGKMCTFKSESSSKNEFLQDFAKEEDAVYSDLSLKMATIDEDRDICQAESCAPLMDSGISQLPRKKLYNLDDSVQVWSDFLRIHFHPRSLCLVEEYNQEDKFSSYGCGLQAYDREDLCGEIEDNLRHFAEECDYLQGFHILMDGYNGFTAVANSILQHLTDYYSSKTCLCFPVYSPLYKLWERRKVANKEALQLVTSILGYNGATTYSNLFAPLYISNIIGKTPPNQDFPYLNYNPELPYHTSAILSLALDTSTLLTRLKRGSILLDEITNGLSIVGRKMAALSFCGPVPIQENCFLNDVLKTENSIKLTSVTPLCKIDKFDSIAQFTVLRGIPETRDCSHDSRNVRMPIEAVLGCFLQAAYPQSMNFYKVTNEACKTIAPFPHIFNSKITSQGYIGRTDRPKDEGVEKISALGGLHNVNSAAESLNLMLELVRASKLQKHSVSIQSGIEYDDFQDAIENVKTLAECYKDN